MICLIKCPCNRLYVGETSQHIRDRICKHKSTIRVGNLLLPIPYQFKEKGHHISQLKYQFIEQVELNRRGGDIKQLLRWREAFGVHTLQTLEPRGLNRDYEIAHLI